jgi:MoaA/NifB/PqqE/SkfB family radical SAM enzyme
LGGQNEILVGYDGSKEALRLAKKHAKRMDAKLEIAEAIARWDPLEYHKIQKVEQRLDLDVKEILNGDSALYETHLLVNDSSPEAQLVEFAERYHVDEIIIGAPKRTRVGNIERYDGKLMLINRLFPKSYPKLDWIQVEISSYCNANCIYCPHFAYRKNWQNRYLPIDTFRNLISAFRKTKLVYLQGWGEPFTHPQFFEMVRLAKEAGCRVGTTSNGTLLNHDIIARLINEGLDIVGFSLAGVDEKNDRIRKGTRIKKVLESMEEIHRAKSKYGSDKPRIHIAYMLLRSGLDELEKLPEFLSPTGADQTVVSSLSFVASPAMESESILSIGEKGYSELKQRLIHIRDDSAKKGAEVHFHIVSPVQNHFSCRENIPRAVVVGSDGSTSPCVMKQIPLQGENYYYVRARKHMHENLSFGNINKDTLNSIWHRQEYQQFVRDFQKGKAPSICRNCLKRNIDNLDQGV